jgi:hypothetical protein
VQDITSKINLEKFVLFRIILLSLQNNNQGCLKLQAEIRPFEPDTDNADAGR